jgi:hypothetical protein
MKMIKDYEVEGCWTSEKRIKRGNCRSCGAMFERVPKDGHYNSKYWELERDDGQILVCCPSGCSEKDAVEKQRKYTNIEKWLTDDSSSWDFKIDLSKIHNAWIDRKGNIIPCDTRMHIEKAEEIGFSEQELESMGWLKITSEEILCNFDFSKYSNPSKKQYGVLFDYCTIHNKLNQYKELEKRYMY